MTKTDLKMAREEAVKCRESGGSLDDCADMAGIDRTTLYRWKDKDASFATALHLARIKFKQSLIRAIRIKDPKFLLQKCFPDEYGDNPIHGESQQYYTNDEDLIKQIRTYLEPLKKQPQ